MLKLGRLISKEEPMPRNICQSGELAEAELRSLCEDCCRRPSCHIAGTFEALMAAADTAFRSIPIMADCPSFLPTQKAIERVTARWPAPAVEKWRKGDQTRILAARGIRDLCGGCHEKGGCDHDTRLFHLRKTVGKTGTNIATSTVCCSNGLTQIAEPGTGE